jgi:hypothetical protein
MLCTFTTKDGVLIVRSDDIRSICDGEQGSLLVWAAGDGLASRTILGTAAENRDRIQQEELNAIGRIEAHRYETQKQLQAGYPVPPIKRGRAS